MTLKAYIGHSLLVAVLASAVPAVAAGLNFMEDAPYTHFTDEDHKIFNEALNDLLNKGGDGETRAWSNPSSKASGKMKALKTFERDGVTCRTLKIANKAKGRSATGEYSFCQQEPGKWALAN